LLTSLAQRVSCAARGPASAAGNTAARGGRQEQDGVCTSRRSETGH
jgi:hypothetical protein